MRWFGRTAEKRAAEGGGSQGGAGFTDAIVQALLNQAAGGATADPTATAAVEAGAGAYARAFALAEVTPDTPATRALTPALLALMARDLVRRGEFVHVVEVGRDGVRLIPAGSWDVRGRWDPLTWRYRVDLFGPSGNITRHLPSASVVHGRYSIDPARPWFGISPLGWARLTGKLHGNIEDALSDEAGATRGHVLPLPAAPVSTDPKVDALADLRTDINTLRGKTALVVSTAGNWGQGPSQEAPRTDWRPQRLGFDAPASAGSLRSETGAAILSALGCSADLFSGGASAREAWRRFLHASLQPLADLLAAELADKLDAPGLSIGFDRLFASDVASRARALKELVAAGVELGEARRLAGLS